MSTNELIEPEIKFNDEGSKWSALETTAKQAFTFWKDFFLLKRGPANDQDLTASDIKTFETIIRCVSWVESKHGTVGSNFPLRDPMQCGNPGDSWWKAINMPIGTHEDRFIDSDGNGCWAVELPSTTEAEPGFPTNAKLSHLSDSKKGHQDPNFNSQMSFFWGVIYLIQKINTRIASGKTYKCGDCSYDRMINGAADYNGGGDPNYKTKIETAWSLITGSDVKATHNCLLDETYASLAKKHIGEFLPLQHTMVDQADVLIQAGHYNHNPWDENTGAVSRFNRAYKEIEWTRIVRDEAVRLLEDAHISVISTDASIKTRKRDPSGEFKVFKVRTAIFLHFDGSENGSSGASVGYDDDSDSAGAIAWKKLYGLYWNFKWHADNYTENEQYYYGYAHTITEDSEFLIEFGDMDNLNQVEWMAPRLKLLGSLVAHFLAGRLGLKDAISIPSPEEVNGAEM